MIDFVFIAKVLIDVPYSSSSLSEKSTLGKQMLLLMHHPPFNNFTDKKQMRKNIFTQLFNKFVTGVSMIFGIVFS